MFRNSKISLTCDSVKCVNCTVHTTRSLLVVNSKCVVKENYSAYETQL